MAYHHAQSDARILLKRLTTLPLEHQDGSSGHSTDGSSKHTQDRDILSRKYEELGRLLALQHLENNVLTSVTERAGPISRQRRKGSLSNHSPRDRRKISARTVGNDHVDLSSQTVDSPSNYMDTSSIKCSTDSDAHQKCRVSHRGKCRPGTKRNNTLQHSLEVSSTRQTAPSTGKPAGMCGEGHRHGAKSSCGKGVTVINPEYVPKSRMGRRVRRPRSSGKTASMLDKPTPLSSSNADLVPSREPIGTFEPKLYGSSEHEATVNMPALSNFNDVIRGSSDEEVEVAEVNLMPPGFVLEGESETRALTHPPSNKQALREESNSLLDRNGVHTSQSGICGENKKRVTFCELPEDTTDTYHRSSLKSLPPGTNSLKSRRASDEDIQMHIILENEIIMELLDSPRPGHYKSGGRKGRNSRRSRKNTEKETGDKQHSANTMNNDTRESASPAFSDDSPSKQHSPRQSDHKLERTDNPSIKSWLKSKKRAIRNQKRIERKQERKKRLAEERVAQEKMEKKLESEEKVAAWEVEKTKEIRQRIKIDRQERKAKKEPGQKTNCNENRDCQHAEKTRKVKGSSHSKKKTVKMRAARKSTVQPTTDEKSTEKCENDRQKISYDNWLAKKRADRKKVRNETKASETPEDKELSSLIASLAKQRIERATGATGRDWNAPEERELKSDLPESDQNIPNPYTLPPQSQASPVEPKCKNSRSDNAKKSAASKKYPKRSKAHAGSSVQSANVYTDVPLEAMEDQKNSSEQLSRRYAWDGGKLGNDQISSSSAVVVTSQDNVIESDGIFTDSYLPR